MPWYSVRMKASELAYTVHIEPVKEGGFWARVPALPGCFSQGETIEETMENTKEAIELYLEGLKADKEDIPEETESSLTARIMVSV